MTVESHSQQSKSNLRLRIVDSLLGFLFDASPLFSIFVYFRFSQLNALKLSIKPS
jgi:hypothetical protein